MNNLSRINGAVDCAQPESYSRLLIDEPPLQVLPSLAVRIGLNEAIVVQQLHYLLRNPRFGKKLAEHHWIFNTYEEWRCGYFPFWSVETIKRTFTHLAKMKLVICCQPEGRLSRRKYYRLDYEKLSGFSEQVKLTSSNGSKRPLPITKTTSKESKETKETSSVEDDLPLPEFKAVWLPDERTKQQKLKTVKPPADYPTERQFDSFLERNGLDRIVNDRPDLYSYLCDNKWHKWEQRLQKWVPIRDWKQFVIALDDKMLQF